MGQVELGAALGDGVETGESPRGDWPSLPQPDTHAPWAPTILLMEDAGKRGHLGTRRRTRQRSKESETGNRSRDG